MHRDVLLLLLLQSGLTVTFPLVDARLHKKECRRKLRKLLLNVSWLPVFHRNSRICVLELYPSAHVVHLLCVHLSWLSVAVTFLFISPEATMSYSPLPPVAAANTVEEQRARWERKRSRTAKELLETEHRYLEQLDLVVTVCIWALVIHGCPQEAHVYFWSHEVTEHEFDASIQHVTNYSSLCCWAWKLFFFFCLLPPVMHLIACAFGLLALVRIQP